jgi:RNA polymerase sigma-70 factor (ECF subfamily)
MPDMAGTTRRADPPGKLIQSCKKGDQHAYHQLFKQTVDDVHRILYRLAGPQKDMEDLVQRVYLAVFGSIASFRGESAFSTWLFGICLKVVRKQSRTLFRRLRLQGKVDREPRPASETPENGAARAQRARRVHQVLQQLPFKLRTVLVLYEMEGFTGKEIARQLDIPEATVWTRLHHARRAFKRSYKWENQVTPTRKHAPP